MKLSDLVVASIPAPGKGNPAIPKKWEGIETLFTPENCDRYMFIMTKERFEQFKEEVFTEEIRDHHYIKSSPYTQVKTGADAYEFFLRVASGLESKNVGESHALCQIKKNWTRFDRRHKEEAGEIRLVVEAAIADASKVQDRILDKMHRVTTNGVAAKSLAGVKGGESVLIIGHEKPTEYDPFDESLDIFTVLGKPNSTVVSNITVSHPVECERGALFTELTAKAVMKKLHKELSVATKSLEEAYEDTNHYDHVFVTAPMGVEKDKELIAKWNTKGEYTGNLVLLSDDNSSIWSSAKVNNFVAASAVSHEVESYIQDNEELIRQASLACKNSALTRDRGLKKVPLYDQMHKETDGYSPLLRIRDVEAIKKDFGIGAKAQRNLKPEEKLHPLVFERAIKSGFATRYAEKMAPENVESQQEIIARFI